MNRIQDELYYALRSAVHKRQEENQCVDQDKVEGWVYQDFANWLADEFERSREDSL